MNGSYLSRKPLKDFTLEDYKALGRLPSLYTKREIKNVRNSVSPQSGHSSSGIIYFIGKNQNGPVERRLFAKQHHHVDDLSTFYQSERDPNKLFTREQRSVHWINTLVGGDFISHPIATDPLFLLQFYRYVQFKSDRDRLLEESNSNRSRAIKYEGHRNIAIIGGRLHAREEKFPRDLLQEKYSTNYEISNLLDQMLVISRHNLLHQGVDFPSDSERFKEFINQKYGLNIVTSVAEIIDSQSSLEYEYTLSHGDCRVHHLKSEIFQRGNPRKKIFLDWEQFGKHRLGFDHVTYSSAENGVSDLPLTELDILSSWVLAYRSAGVQSPKNERRKAIKNLDELASDRRRIVTKVNGNERDKFSLQYLAQKNAEDIHLDSSNKRYSSEQRAGHIIGISGWTEERMLEDRLNRVQDRLNFIAIQAPFTAVENPLGAQYHFYLWAKLLMKLELVNLPQETMNALSKR
ncbi:hypothetical protein HQ489_00615 [Candidatus Woesearchaeota archaeon]|nr:hypothetical protein [Candidatus Woesearchaeota archaeon]